MLVSLLLGPSCCFPQWVSCISCCPMCCHQVMWVPGGMSLCVPPMPLPPCVGFAFRLIVYMACLPLAIPVAAAVGVWLPYAVSACCLLALPPPPAGPSIFPALSFPCHAGFLGLCWPCHSVQPLVLGLAARVLSLPSCPQVVPLRGP